MNLYAADQTPVTSLHCSAHAGAKSLQLQECMLGARTLAAASVPATGPSPGSKPQPLPLSVCLQQAPSTTQVPEGGQRSQAHR